MNLKRTSQTLTKLFTTLGNEFITTNFQEQPFYFTVFLKEGDPMFEESDYVAEVHTDRFLPKKFKLKDNPEKYKSVDFLKEKFEEMINYVGEIDGKDKKIQVRFMDLDYR